MNALPGHDRENYVNDFIIFRIEEGKMSKKSEPIIIPNSGCFVLHMTFVQISKHKSNLGDNGSHNHFLINSAGQYRIRLFGKVFRACQVPDIGSQMFQQ